MKNTPMRLHFEGGMGKELNQHMKKQAFFYKNHYYLLPDDMANTDALIAAYAGKPAFSVTELTEKKCMAPYFVITHTKEKMLKLPKNPLLFPCEVELLTMKEYNNRLRAIVPEACKGCPNFGSVDETDASLQGHHEEITLNRVCFWRNEVEAVEAEEEISDYGYFNQWMKSFVDQFDPEAYAALIDNGETEEAESRFYGELSYLVFECIPPVFFTHAPAGKYALYSTAFLEEQDALMMETLFVMLEKKHGKSWVFKNYIPKGFMVKEAKRPLGIRAEAVEGPVTYLSVDIFTEPEGETPAYLWLCGTFGETEYLTACINHHIYPVENQADLPEDILPPEALGGILDSILKPIKRRKKDIMNPPPHLLFGCTAELNEDTPDYEDQLYRRGFFCSIRAGRLVNEFIMPLRQGQKPANVWEEESILAEMGLPIARFVFSPIPAERLTQLHTPVMSRYMDTLTELFKVLSDKRLYKCFSQSTGDGCFENNGYVLNLTQFLYVIRKCAPIFDVCPGELYIYTKSHQCGGHYRLDFDMTLLHTEQELWDNLS